MIEFYDLRIDSMIYHSKWGFFYTLLSRSRIDKKLSWSQDPVMVSQNEVIYSRICVKMPHMPTSQSRTSTSSWKITILNYPQMEMGENNYGFRDRFVTTTTFFFLFDYLFYTYLLLGFWCNWQICVQKGLDLMCCKSQGESYKYYKLSCIRSRVREWKEGKMALQFR